MNNNSAAHSSGILVGWTKTEKDTPIGFTSVEPVSTVAGKPVSYKGEGHLMTIAPTGAGKGVGCVVPAIIQHDGPIVVMDVKGENYAMTRRHRSAIGSTVSCIDPFGVTRRGKTNHQEDDIQEMAGFNPFDLLPYLSDDHDTACRSLAEMIVARDSHTNDPFWRHAAIGVIASLIKCYDGFKGPMRSLTAIVNDLAIEVPEADTPGQISPTANALSILSAHANLLDEMDKQGLSVEDVCSAYASLFDSAAEQNGFADPLTIATEAAYSALVFCQENNTRDLPIEELAANMGNVIVEQSHFNQFSAQIFFSNDQEALTQELVEHIWEVLIQSKMPTHATAKFGSFAHKFTAQEALENYPLALHRIALSPGHLCRSTAAQPLSSSQTWGSIILIVKSELAQFSGRSISRTLGSNKSIDLEAIRQGDDTSIYIVFPPARVKSHATLFRLIVEGILSVVVSRDERPQRNTLLLLDEVAQLGRLDLLITAKTLLRGYGVQVWSFWQDISQLKMNYPMDWQTILNNCRVIQVFGKGSGVMAADLSNALDVGPDRILDLDEDNLLAWIDGEKPITLRRPVCYSDPNLKDLCDDGPYANLL